MFDRDYILDDYSKANAVCDVLKKMGFTYDENLNIDFAPQLYIDAKAKTFYFIYNTYSKFTRYKEDETNVIVYSEFVEMVHAHKYPLITKLGYERKGFISQEAYDDYVEMMLRKAYELGVKDGYKS
jgi:hypothetical protein